MPLASKVFLLKMLIDFGKLGLLMFWGAGKRLANKYKKQIDCEFRIQTIIQVGALSSGSGYFS